MIWVMDILSPTHWMQRLVATDLPWHPRYDGLAMTCWMYHLDCIILLWNIDPSIAALHIGYNLSVVLVVVTYWLQYISYNIVAMTYWSWVYLWYHIGHDCEVQHTFDNIDSETSYRAYWSGQVSPNILAMKYQAWWYCYGTPAFTYLSWQHV